MKWTDEQLQAINLSGTNIIVSAGAGSGKTAVLTERIIAKLKQGINIRDLIILTFTNAAAREMKARIRHKLLKEIDNGNNQLKESLNYLDQAIITTYDSFSLLIVRKYHYLLNISRDINIGDNIIINTEKKRIFDEIFNSYYEEENALFLSFVDLYTTKDDNNIKDNLLLLTNEIDKIYDIDLFFSQYEDKFLNDKKNNDYLNEYGAIITKNCHYLAHLLTEMTSTVSDKQLYQVYLDLKEFVDNLLKLNSYNDYKQYLDTKLLPKLSSSKNIDKLELETFKGIYQDIKTVYDEILELCSYESEEEIINEIKANWPFVKLILEILQKYYQKINAFKLENNLFEFSDISRLAIKILEQNPDIRSYYQNNIKEIMIDEYQDTNDINDYFISLIANHNLYMVGDVKQSIYRFRNANPYLFMHKYKRYAENDDGRKIDLNKNFRSHPEVIEDINTIFSHIMDEKLGGAKYNPDHLLQPGNTNYEAINGNHNIEIINYDYKNSEVGKGYTKDEIEAFIIANDIKNRINNHFQVFDKNTNQIRDLEYQDICILMDRKSNFDLYKKIFTYLNMPLYMHRDEEFIYSDEIYALRSLLRLIGYYNHLELDDYIIGTFMSIGRSFIYEYSDEQIFKVILKMKEENIDLFQALQNQELGIYQDLEYLSVFANEHSISELINEIYSYLDIYNKIIKLGNVQAISIKLQFLLDLVSNLEQSGYHLFELINYFDEAFNQKIDINYNISNNNTNSINLMSIHKSKGLEFPICYYSGLYKDFSKQDLQERFIFNNKYGFCLPIFKEGLKNNIVRKLIVEAYNSEDIAERLRVFYVALTRAREKIIMVGDFNGENKTIINDIVPDIIRRKYKSFGSVIYSLKPILKNYFRDIDLNTISLSKSYELVTKTTKIDVQNYIPINLVETRIKKEKITSNHYSSYVNYLQSSKILEVGTNIHEYLEYIDFKNINDSLNKYPIDAKIKDRIYQLMDMPFMKDIEKAKIYKEYPFIINTNNEIKRGIIDLIIEHNDHIIVVDYKLSNINNEHYINQVQGYIDYLKTVSIKRVEGYIYSINNGEYIKV